MTKRVKIGLSIATLVGATLVVLVNFTNVCGLQAVTLDGAPVENWPEQYSMLESRSIARQSLDSLAKAVLARDDVFKVNVDLSGLHTVAINTNEYTPECFLVDRKSGKLYGLDERARVLPLDNATPDWERPVLTGLRAGNFFQTCRAAGVQTLVDELRELRDEREDFYRLIEEIRFEQDGSLTTQVAGLAYRLRMVPERFCSGIDQYLKFATKFDTDLTEITQMDVRIDNMVVTRGGK